MIRAFSASLSLRLLGIFIITAILIIVILISLFSKGLNTQWRGSIQPHLIQYAQYLQHDLGSPPQLERAKALADQLTVNIFVYKDAQFLFSTTSKPLRLASLKFSPVSDRLPRGSTDGFARSGIAVSVSGRDHSHRGILRIVENDYSVYYDLHVDRHRRGSSGNRRSNGNEMIVALLALAIVLMGSFLLIRQQLLPIRQIQKSVRRMAEAELDHRIGREGRSDLDRLAQSIDSMAGRIQAMLDAKRQLLIAISHELRSPLTRARISTELLPESINRERLVEDIIEMERMITDIMESEQLQHSHTVLNLDTIDLAELLGDELTKVLPGQHLQLSNPGKPVLYRGDALRLRILLRNLVVNALQHGRSSDGELRLTVALHESPNSVELHVEDQGSGIEPQHLQEVADPFYRPDPSRSRDTGGFGLGLTLARLIVEAHGGTLQILSDPAQQPGTRIHVKLPHSATAIAQDS